MTALRVLSLSPFVPSGEHYESSRRFFAELGFEEIWENGGCAGFKSGDAQFILQKLENSDFAENFMVTIVVPNLDLWWDTIRQMRLDDSYPGVRFRPPTDFPWGREVHFADLAGVCWHVRQQE
jgi:hypothetical protein